MLESEVYFFNLIKEKISIVFDIGTRQDIDYIESNPNLEYHLFEPNLQSCLELEDKLKNYANSNIKLNKFGLGNIDSILKYYPNSESFIRRAIHMESDVSKAIDFQIKRFSDYVKDNNITHIDFLKIDTKGCEPDILLPYYKWIKSNVNYIQFEYASTWLDRQDDYTIFDVYDRYNNEFSFYILYDSEHPISKKYINKLTKISGSSMLQEIEDHIINQFGFNIVMINKSKTRKQYVISNFQRDYQWIRQYSDDVIVYNTGVPYTGDNVINIDNKGNGSNQRNMFRYFIDNYNKLPDVMVFLQDYPFDHCPEDKLTNFLKRDELTCLEWYHYNPKNNYENRDKDEGFLEKNNSWYIEDNNKKFRLNCVYKSFDDFMNKYFSNYKRLDWIRFAPGCQYIVTPKEVLQYPKYFWQQLHDEIRTFGSTEAHITERALYLIFTGEYKLR